MYVGVLGCGCELYGGLPLQYVVAVDKLKFH